MLPIWARCGFLAGVLEPLLMGIRRSFALVAVVLLALAGCGSDDSGDADGESATEPTSIDAALLECGEVTENDSVVQLSDVDLAQATWEVPDGFVETFDYSEDLPVEHVDTIRVAQPEKKPQPLNVLTVVVYSDLDWGDDLDECGRVPQTAVDSRLEGYREHNEAEPITEVSEVEIGGLPAYEQQLELPSYSYEGYWLFSRTQLMHVYCQWTSEEEREPILNGCEDLVASLEVPGA